MRFGGYPRELAEGKNPLHPGGAISLLVGGNPKELAGGANPLCPGGAISLHPGGNPGKLAVGGISPEKRAMAESAYLLTRAVLFGVAAEYVS